MAKNANDYILMTDSCVDLPDEIAKNMGLIVQPLSVRVNETDYTNYLDGREISPEDFYKLVDQRAKTQTSQVTLMQFVETMEPYLIEGKDILYIAFSSALSGTYSSAVQAKLELEERYPNNNIVIIDSTCASLGQGLLVTYAYSLKDKGESIHNVAKWVEENKIRISHLFTVDDLHHLKRGGRLSSMKAFIGTIIRVKPLLHVNSEGKLTVFGKAKGRRSSIEALVERIVSTIDKQKEQMVYISHANAYEDALLLKEMIKEKLNIDNVLINFIGPVIGSHTGSGTIAVFYLGTDRIENPE